MLKDLNNSSPFLIERIIYIVSINKDFMLLRIEDEIHRLETEYKDLEDMVSRGSITLTDAEEEWQEIMERTYKQKEKYVQRKHVKKDGTPKKIAYHEPTGDYPNGYYYTKISDNYKPKRATMMELILVLYDHYHKDDEESEPDFSIKSIWEQAYTELKETKTSTQKTFSLIQSYYNRYIDETLALMDITKMNLIDLQKYTKKIVSGSKKISVNNYNEYKQVLNILFRYARVHGLVKEDLPLLLDNQEYKKLCKPKNKNAEEKILSEKEIDLLRKNAQLRCEESAYNVYGYMILLSIETGMRAAELCSLKWEDIKEDCIHIHTQQLEERNPIRYHEVDWTKNEKGVSQNGRNFPLTNSISNVLKALKETQKKFNINSKYVFCREDGEWVPKRAYEKVLAYTCQKLNLPKTNNHALRMSLNSNVLIPKGMPVTTRAKILGHSVETNLNFYSFESKDYIKESAKLLNA